MYCAVVVWDNVLTFLPHWQCSGCIVKRVTLPCCVKHRPQDVSIWQFVRVFPLLTSTHYPPPFFPLVACRCVGLLNDGRGYTPWIYIDIHRESIWTHTGNIYGHPPGIYMDIHWTSLSEVGICLKKILKGNYGGGGIQTTEWTQRASNFCKQVTPPTQDRL